MKEFNYSIKGFGVVSDVSIEYIFKEILNKEILKHECVINFTSGTVTSEIASIEINSLNKNLKINFGKFGSELFQSNKKYNFSISMSI